jgi:PleD family two-component response regulator
MPDMDGFEATSSHSRVRAEERRHTPIFAMDGARDDGRPASAAWPRGWIDYISKPLQKSALLAFSRRRAGRKWQPRKIASRPALACPSWDGQSAGAE